MEHTNSAAILINVLTNIVLTSLIIFGIHTVFKEGYLFGRVGDNIRKFSLILNTKRFPNGWIHLVIIGCPPCMAYYWGPILHYLWGFEFSVYTVYKIIAISGLNYIINGIIYED